MIVFYTYNMTNASLTKEFSSGFRVTTCHKYKFKLGFDLPQYLPYSLWVHLHTLPHIILKQQVVLLLLHPMPTKMQYLNRLFHPIVKLIHSRPLPNIRHPTLNLLQQLLDDWLLLEIVDLLLDLLTMNVEHGLTVEEEEWGGKGLVLTLLALVALDVLHEHLA